MRSIEARLVDLEGELGDHDRLAIALADLLDADARAHRQSAAAGAVGGGDLLGAVDDAAGGEVRSRHVLHSAPPVAAPGSSNSAMHASTVSVRLCGGMLVAMPTAMPVCPFTSRFGTRVGSTEGSCSDFVVVGVKSTVSLSMSASSSCAMRDMRTSV